MPGPIHKAVRSAGTQRASSTPARPALVKRLPFTGEALQDFIFYKRPKNVGFVLAKTPPAASDIVRSVDVTRHDDYGHTMIAHVAKDGSLFLEDRNDFPILNDPKAAISVWSQAAFVGTHKPIGVAEKVAAPKK